MKQLLVTSPVSSYTGHEQKSWHKMKTIVEVLPFKQYKIKLNGSGCITLYD